MTSKDHRRTSSKKIPKSNRSVAYWMTRSPEERLNEVERLRRQVPGGRGRIKKVIRIISLKEDI